MPALTAEPVPAAVARVVEVMQGFPGEWCLCGGWAVDAWLGLRTREHQDVDVAVFEDDSPFILQHFDGWQLWAHDEKDPDSESQWDGGRLILPAHIHARRDDVNLDIQVTARAAGRWVFQASPRVELNLTEAITDSGWGLPTLAPHAVLLYKALERRPQDLTDIAALGPALTPTQDVWLSNAIALCDSTP